MSDLDQDRILKLVESMSGVGHWRYDVIGGSVAWSDQVYAIHGVRRETFNPNLDDSIAFYHVEDRASVVASLERAISDQEDYAFQLRLVLADGDLRHVICRATCEIDKNGGTSAVVGVFQDITDTVDTLAAVKASEGEHRLLTENATDIIARYGWDGTFRYVSPAIKSVLGYEPEEIVGRQTFDMMHPDDRAFVKEQFRRCATSGEADREIRVQYRARHKDGCFVWLENHPKALFDTNGRVLEFHDVARDVTIRRDIEEKLQASEARYRLLADNSGDIVTECDLSGRFKYVSPAVARISGYSPDEVIGRKAIDFVHPDDKDHVEAEIKAALLGMGDREIEHRHLRKDGCVIWVQSRPRLARDPDTGRPFAITDVIRDITARKSAEAALVESEARYRLLADNASDMIVQSTARGEITFISPGCLQTVGYGVEELLGRNTLDLIHPDDVPGIIAHYSALIAKGFNSTGEPTQFRSRHKDGRWIWLEGRPTIFFNPKTGKYDAMQDVVRDITERKALEMELEGARVAAESATSEALREIRERKLLEQQLREAAETDPLTGLPNRRAFLRHLKAAIAACDRGRCASLAMIDLDFFKRVNDEHGHGVGDTALTLLGDLCRDFVRTNDVVARIGGEEFALVLNDAELAEAHGVSNRLRIKIAGCQVPIDEGRFISLSASIGVAPIRPGANCDQVMATADAALYRAKSNGRNQVVIFD